MLQNKLRKKSYRLAFAAVGLFLMGHAPAVFAQCTTSSWTNTTGSVTAVGSTNERTELEYEGSCGLSVNAASSPGYVTSGAPNQDQQVLSRFYIYADELTLANEEAEAIVFQARGNSATQVQVAIQRLGIGLGLVMRYRSNGELVEIEDIAPLLPTWQAVTVGWSADAIGGTVYLKLDEVEMLRAEGLVNGNENVNNLDLGLVNDVSGSGKIVVDAFEARRAMPEPALLTVNELFNISTRSYVGSGVSNAVAGFVIDGATKKCIIVRGRGPSINLDTTRVSNPQISLVNPTTQQEVDFNDNWQDHPNADVVAAAGRAPSDPNEAAMYICLDPGIYTVNLAPAPGSNNGIGIIEVLDFDRGTPFLFNISTRADVRTGDQLAIAGFVIEGDLPKTLLIRGRGPTIQLQETLLANPTLTLFDQSGVVEGSNDNWQDADNADDIAETGRAPGNDLESAILVTLDPGLYTAHLQSASSQTGIGIIEVLDLTGGSIEDN